MEAKPSWRQSLISDLGPQGGEVKWASEIRGDGAGPLGLREESKSLRVED